MSYSRDTVIASNLPAAGLCVCGRIALKAGLPVAVIGVRERYVWDRVLNVRAERALRMALDCERVAAARYVAPRRRG